MKKAILFFAYLGAFSGVAHAESPGRLIDLDSEDRRIIAQSVAEYYSDPWSAQIGAMSAAQFPDGSISACGMVNAKNRQGGYVGFTPFNVYLLEAEEVLDVLRAEEVGPEAVTQLCSDLGLTLSVWE